jgi:glycosyltransferase involved in cell wall biosynthesis
MTPDHPDGGPLVSICIPAFNSGPWIGEAIESALAQTWTSFEIVVCDDASTDETLAFARSFSDQRIHVHANRTRLGKSRNQNRAIGLSSGTYVKFLHADDKLNPTCLEEMVAVALEDERIGLVFAGRDVEVEGDVDPDWGEKYARLHEGFTKLERINDGRSLFKQLLRSGLDENWIGEPSAVMVSRRALERSGYFNERIHQIDDLDLWLRILLWHAAAFIDRPLCVYRRHGESSTFSNQRQGRDWLDRVWLLDGLLAEALDPEDREEVERLRRAALRRAARSQLGRLARGRFGIQLPLYLGRRAFALNGRSRARSVKRRDRPENRR